MLGERIGEISGKVTMQRVLPNLGGDPKMETSFQASGSVLGTNIKDTGTYTTIFRPEGTQYGEGQGVMITKEKRPAYLHRRGSFCFWVFPYPGYPCNPWFRRLLHLFRVTNRQILPSTLLNGRK